MSLPKNSFRTFSAAVVTIAIVAGTASAQSGRSRMEGFVVDETDVHGIAGATVELRGDPNSARLRSTKLVATTNERGEYSFKNIPYGDYILRVTAPGFTTYQINIYILSDAVTQLHVKLRKTKRVSVFGWRKEVR